jgi:hypothetical protein
MDFETLFADTLTDTVTLREPTSTDMYGAPTFVGATTVTCPAWVSRKPRAVRTLGGEEKVSSAVIWLGHPTGGGEVPLPTTRCEITLSDGSKPLILHVESITDPSNNRHVAVYC